MLALTLSLLEKQQKRILDPLLQIALKKYLSEERFVHLPSLDPPKLAQAFRTTMVAFFLRRQLINERLAPNMLDRSHSGFSVDGSVRIAATSGKTRLSLAQYLARPPMSLQKMLAVITDPQQVHRILRHRVKTGAAPPGLHEASLT